MLEYLGYRVVEHLLLWILLLDAREHILNILFHISQNYPFLSKSKIPIQAYNVTVIAIQKNYTIQSRQCI